MGMLNRVSDNMDTFDGQYCNTTLFCDRKKVFDSVDHEILLPKLVEYKSKQLQHFESNNFF